MLEKEEGWFARRFFQARKAIPIPPSPVSVSVLGSGTGTGVNCPRISPAGNTLSWDVEVRVACHSGH
jgi:hypothetical protein